ncbi:MAG: hydroxyacid dehydrogenase [Geminicoccaceae bacterium]
MPRVLVGGKIHDSGLDVLHAAPDLQIDYVNAVEPEALEPFLPCANAILLRTQPFGAEVIDRCPALQIVSRHGVGYDTVDVDALNARGIPLTIVGDVNARSVAEHAMMLLLAASHRLLAYDAATRHSADWGYRNSLEGREIAGKRLLIIGLGRIGRQLAKMAAGFDLDVFAYDPYQRTAPPDNVTMVDDLDAALTDADLVSLHIPKTDGVLLDAARLARMKPSAVIVNTARGGSVDEPALASALFNKTIHGAGLDVFTHEPPEADNPLIASRYAVLTPHIAGLSLECAARMATVSAQNIVDFFAGRLDPNLVVNAEALGLDRRAEKAS